MKPNYLLRTLSRDITDDLTNRFIALQLRVLKSLFERRLDANLMDWFCLPFARGGLGLLNYKDVHHIAHISSVFGLKSLSDSYLSILKEE